MAAHEDQPTDYRVVYLFVAGRPDRRVELRAAAPTGTAPAIPSLAALSFPAGRFEREMRDLYGITPLDHPLPRRLVRHQHWPQGWYPMRADAGPPPPFGSPEEPYPFLTVEGPGVYEIPVGPDPRRPDRTRPLPPLGGRRDHPQAQGPAVVRPQGHREAGRGTTLADVVPLAERVSGDTAVGHTLAFCLAVEDALDWPVPARASVMRAVLLELERLYNHVTDLGALCNDVGHGILNAHALRVREQLLRLNARVTGHRLLRGAVFPGGARLRERPDRRTSSSEIAADVAEIVDAGAAPQRRPRPVHRHRHPDRGTGRRHRRRRLRRPAPAAWPSTPATTTPSPTPPQT